MYENRSKGRTYARATLRVAKGSGRVVQSAVRFVSPEQTSTVGPDPTVTALLAPYRTLLAQQFDGKIGEATGIFPRGGNVERLGGTAEGDLVADAMRTTYGTQVAFTNGGGLRDTLPSTYLPRDTTLRRPQPGYAPGPPYDLVVGDAYAVLPFGNSVVTRTVTGQQLWAVLERSVGQLPAAFGGFLQISGLRFTYDPARPTGSRVVSVTLDDGAPVARDSTTYTAATNDFTNAGGDGYVELVDGQGVTRDLLATVLLDHIRAQGTISPTTDGRISPAA